MQAFEEGMLIDRAAAGDGAAWSRLVDLHLSPLVAFAWYRLGDHGEAEDVAQETMLRFSKKAKTWEPDGARLRTWLYRVANNLCIDRQRARRSETPIDETPEVAPIDPQPQLERKLDISQVVHGALSGLPRRQQAVLVLVYCLGHRVREAAEIMQISEHAAESLLSRARHAMRVALEPDREALAGIGI